MNVSLTIKYDGSTYNLLRITRCKIIELRQNMCTFAIAACDGVQAAMSLVESLSPTVMHVNTIFIISASNS